MTEPHHDDQLRARIEAGLVIAGPLLDLLIAVGDRVSRLLGAGEPDALPPGIRVDGGRAARSLPALEARGDGGRPRTSGAARPLGSRAK